MARSVIFLAAIFLSFCTLSCIAQQQPCTTYKFSNNKQFSSCSDLPVLSSSLHWNYHPLSSRVEVAFRHTGVTDRRWIAWAINPTSGGMIGSQAIVSFQRTDGSLAVYTSPITSYGTRWEQGNLSFPVLDLSATNQNNEMIIYASLELHGNISTVNHLWQAGPMSENTPMMHSVAPSSPNVKSMGSLDFLSGRIKATRRSSTTLKNVHGILNTVSWGILMPVGAVIARYLKKFESAGPLWFYLHVSCQLLAYILGGLSGFGTGIFLGKRSHGIEHSCHKIIGIVLFCLATAQVFGGLVRPDKDSKYRPFFNWFHFLAGCSTLILSIFNIYKGFDILHAARFWRLTYSGIILALLLVTLLLEICTRWVREGREFSLVVLFSRLSNEMKSQGVVRGKLEDVFDGFPLTFLGIKPDLLCLHSNSEFIKQCLMGHPIWKERGLVTELLAFPTVHSLPTAQLTLERSESSGVLQVKLRGIMEQLKQVSGKEHI
ncbi:hypothetical protein POTOM_059528 [Populus tomentosa]|uniref:Cytochrome b561 and DOMON domain-containing protein n=1 Tax=Populus tomentosa TaxID=118781 RepID=A0A8X7XPN6_POPTO|nr:hypothetical protein POTOM_059528 [Populus tomentosa]